LGINLPTGLHVITCSSHATVLLLPLKTSEKKTSEKKKKEEKLHVGTGTVMVFRQGVGRRPCGGGVF